MDMILEYMTKNNLITGNRRKDQRTYVQISSFNDIQSPADVDPETYTEYPPELFPKNRIKD